jgi:hypothetical protein
MLKVIDEISNRGLLESTDIETISDMVGRKLNSYIIAGYLKRDGNTSQGLIEQTYQDVRRDIPQQVGLSRQANAGGAAAAGTAGSPPSDVPDNAAAFPLPPGGVRPQDPQGHNDNDDGFRLPDPPRGRTDPSSSPP